jgi:hypothetical protein
VQMYRLVDGIKSCLSATDFLNAIELFENVRFSTYIGSTEKHTGLRREVPQDNVPHTYNCQVATTSSDELG